MADEDVVRLDGDQDATTNPVPLDELPGDDGAAQERTDLQGDAGDERQARVAQRVTPEHAVGRDSLGPSEVDEVALQREDHVGAQEATPHGAETQAQGERREEEVLEVL